MSLTRILGLLSVLTLAACASVPQGPCPNAIILGDAHKITKFAPGNGQDPTDVMWTAEIIGVNAQCEYVENGIVLNTPFVVRVERGPALNRNQVSVPMFIALTRTNKELIDKARFDLTVTFVGGSSVADHYDTIPGSFLEPGKGKDGSYYETLIGFQLTPSQLQYNRSQRP